jgi:hypothetical protein
VRRLLIAGIGNVLLGDDGVGPFVIKVLESQLPLSTPVRQCIPLVIDAVRRELYRLDTWCEPKAGAGIPDVWWDPIFKQRKERECFLYASD